MAAEEWFRLDSGKCDSAFNMALDEALLEAMSRLQRPVLRFYGWHEPAATFGYFQKYRDVAQSTLLRPLIRRPTGGGIVPHDRDWTYSAAFPTSHEWYSATAVASYRRIHDWIRLAFARLGIAAELAPAAVKTLPGQCFAGCERFDVMLGGRKIAGAAQRRRRDGLLIQGSVQPAFDAPARADWEAAMCLAGETERGIRWLAMCLEPAIEQRARELAEIKYSQSAYNRKR